VLGQLGALDGWGATALAEVVPKGDIAKIGILVVGADTLTIR
jgi:hypothetical protein